MKLPLSVGHYVGVSLGHKPFFSNVSHRIFLNFSEKYSFSGKSPKIPPSPFMCLFWLKKCPWQCSLWFCENFMSGKNLVLQFWSKWLSANQTEGFFDNQYLWKESIERWSSTDRRLPFLVGFGQLYLSNQIAGFFDHQYLWKESIDDLLSLHEDNH